MAVTFLAIPRYTGLPCNGRQNLVVPESEFFCAGLTDEHVLHVLVIPRPEVGLSFLQRIKLMPFKRLD